MSSLMKANKEKFNYYFDPNEKLLSLQDIKNSSSIASQFFNNVCKNNPTLEQKCYKIFYSIKYNILLW